MNVYLDNAATTKMDKEVVESMLPYFTDIFGNVSSVHTFGRKGIEAVDKARKEIALLIGGSSNEIYFTSGGTESDNWALEGVSRKFIGKKKHIITTVMEHPAVINTAKVLENNGFEVTYLNIDKNGLINLDELKSAINEQTFLVSVMMVNNETGVIQPIKEIGEICRKNGILFHTDAVQAFPYRKINVVDENIDMMSCSAHKFHGPKGIGFLYIKNGLIIDNLLNGGHQERGMRPGTTNTAGIVGMAKALNTTVAEMEKNNEKILNLREKFIKSVIDNIPNCHINGDIDKAVCGIVNICFENIKSASMVNALDLEGIAVSAGSACVAGSVKSSYVIKALSGSDSDAESSVRFSFDKYNMPNQIDYVIEKLCEIVKNMRKTTNLFKIINTEGKFI